MTSRSSCDLAPSGLRLPDALIHALIPVCRQTGTLSGSPVQARALHGARAPHVSHVGVLTTFARLPFAREVAHQLRQLRLRLEYEDLLEGREDRLG